METAHGQSTAADAEHYQPCKKTEKLHTFDCMLTDLQSFNVVTQHDSHVLKNDSKSMKAIAVVTVAFLPLATVAVRDDSLPVVHTTLTDEVGSLWLAIFQLRCPNKENLSRK